MSTGAIVLTGNEKAFAAGADIKEMQDITYSQASNTNFIASWSAVLPHVRKPVIAAVNGHALGGGCELALMADILYCSTGAKFGQPEIKLGIIPGAGGSQRLTALVGKSRAMELILTGNMFGGADAEKWGVAAKCFSTAEECLEGALATAERIAGYSKMAVRSAKEVVNKSQEVGLREGLDYERKVFHGLFGSRDQKIGESLSIQTSVLFWKQLLIKPQRNDGVCPKRETELVERMIEQLKQNRKSFSYCGLDLTRCRRPEWVRLPYLLRPPWVARSAIWRGMPWPYC